MTTVAPEVIPLAEFMVNANLLLSQTGEELRHAVTATCRYIAGNFFITDKDGVVIRRNVDLRKLGAELGILAPWEELDV